MASYNVHQAYSHLYYHGFILALPSITHPAPPQPYGYMPAHGYFIWYQPSNGHHYYIHHHRQQEQEEGTLVLDAYDDDEEEEEEGTSVIVDDDAILSIIRHQHVKTRQASEEDQDSICVVCQESLLCCPHQIGTLPCNHEYHIHCIAAWLCRKNVCPLCKATV